MQRTQRVGGIAPASRAAGRRQEEWEGGLEVRVDGRHHGVQDLTERGRTGWCRGCSSSALFLAAVPRIIPGTDNAAARAWEGHRTGFVRLARSFLWTESQ